MNTGRDEFRRYKFVVNIIVEVFKKLPDKGLMFIWNCVNAQSGKLAIGVRYCILKVLCKECGDNVYIAANVEIKNFNNLVLGSNVSIHRFCYIDAIGGVQIGSEVSIAHSSSIVSFNHAWSNEDMAIKYNPITTRGIIIEEDVWIGCGVRILDGVKICRRSIVAAGSVVIKEVKSKTLVGGVPCKELKNLNR